MNQNTDKQVKMSCQVSQIWQQKIEKIATDRNKSSEDILAEAIALYLGEVGANSHDRLMALEGDVAVLKQMLSQFNTTLTLLQQQQFSKNSSESSTSLPLISPPALESVVENAIAEEEDWEDEPDEILYDFLEPN